MVRYNRVRVKLSNENLGKIAKMVQDNSRSVKLNFQPEDWNSDDGVVVNLTDSQFARVDKAVIGGNAISIVLNKNNLDLSEGGSIFSMIGPFLRGVALPFLKTQEHQTYCYDQSLPMRVDRLKLPNQ